MCELLHTRAKKAQVVGADRQAALRDLRLEIKSESLERVMHDTPFGSSLESPGPPGAFFKTQPRGFFGGSLWASSGHSLWTTSRISSEITPMYSTSSMYL